MELIVSADYLQPGIIQMQNFDTVTVKGNFDPAGSGNVFNLSPPEKRMLDQHAGLKFGRYGIGSGSMTAARQIRTGIEG